MATTKKLMGTTAVGGAELLAIEDVFSTWLYTGNGSTQTITNGIDLAGEGGLVWIKDRSAAFNHAAHDTEQGATKYLTPNSTNIALTTSGFSFNSNGFTVGSLANDNRSGDNFASWTWRKAPRWFDVVTYTGDGVAGRAISHNLGIEPGFIVVKRLNAAEGWFCQHRNLGADKRIQLDLIYAATDEGNIPGTQTWYDTPTDSVFYVGSTNRNNGSGSTYVAYLFAHDPLGPSGDGSDGLIACGSYTGTGAVGNAVDLGFEPQFLLIKSATAAYNWHIFDTMRGITDSGNATLYPNSSNAEVNAVPIQVNSNGFTIQTTGAAINGNTGNYIYIAIRRGPMRQPTSGTEVFAVDVDGTSGTPAAYTAGFPVDLGIYKSKLNAYSWSWNDRLRGAFSLKSDSTAAESANSLVKFDNMTGWADSAALTSEYPSWMFRRAPGFFDVVIAPWADGSTNKHNLGVVPELIIKKTRSTVNDWYVWTTGFNNDDYLLLNSTAAKSNNVGNLWSSITATDFTTTNYGVTTSSVFYLFATLPGVSKVGSYTGNGGTGDINVDCGFTSGARFVLIKDATSANDWYVWDTARGIVAGNDPYLRLNSTGAETTDSDWVDPYSAGFTVTTGLYANLRINVLGNTYIYLAIA